MSVHVMARVFEQSESTGNDRLVLLAIADEADDDGTSAFPSQERIAEKARVPRRTVQRCLDRLELAEEIFVTRPEAKGRGHFNRYELRRYARVKARQSDADLRPAKARQSDADSGSQQALAVEKKGSEGRTKASPSGAVPLDPQTQEKDLPATPSRKARTSPEADAITREWWERNVEVQGWKPDSKHAFVSMRQIIHHALTVENYTADEVRQALLRIGARMLTKAKLSDQCYGIRREQAPGQKPLSEQWWNQEANA